MHILRFDEDTHQSRNFLRLLISVPQKRAPIEVCSTSTGVNPGFSSQEPRRPRFSFFNSSQCQRADLTPSPAETSQEENLPIPPKEQKSTPGCPAAYLPFQKRVSSVGSARASRVVDKRGYMGGPFRRQHPRERKMTFLSNT